MTGPFNGGTAGAANPHDGTPYMGKTGTTDDSVHTWLVGSSHKASTALWVGNISGKQQTRKIKVNGITASLLRNVIFKAIAKSIDAYGYGTPDGYPAPSGQFLTGSPATVPVGLIGGTPEQAQQAHHARRTDVRGWRADRLGPSGRPGRRVGPG